MPTLRGRRPSSKARVLRIQTKLHQWATDDPNRRFDDLYNLVHDPAVLVDAWARVRSNRGARSAGVDGRTAHHITTVVGEQGFLTELRDDLKARRFSPGSDDPQARRQISSAGHRDRARPGGAGRPQDGARADPRDGFQAVQLRLPSRTPGAGRDRRDPLLHLPLIRVGRGGRHQGVLRRNLACRHPRPAAGQSRGQAHPALG